MCTLLHSIGVESIPKNRNNISKDTKNGFGNVTSASDDDHYHAHKIILAAASQFLKAKRKFLIILYLYKTFGYETDYCISSNFF